MVHWLIIYSSSLMEVFLNFSTPGHTYSHRKGLLFIATFLVSVTLFTFGCEKGAVNEAQVVSKKMKIEIPEDMKATLAADSSQHDADAEKTEQKKEVIKPVAKKPASTAVKPKVSWIKPEQKTAKTGRKRPTTKRTATKTKTTTVAKKSVTTTKTPSTSTETRTNEAKPYVVNLASYDTLKYAEQIMRKIRLEGYNAYVAKATVNGTDWFRVRVGFYNTEEEAQTKSKELSKEFNKKGAWITRPLWSEIDKYK